MKQLLTLLIGIALAPRVGLADEPKAAAADAKADSAPAAKGRPVAEVFNAIGEAIKEQLAPAVEADADPQFVQQFTTQFRQLLTTELHFVRTVCEPTPEQYKTIKAAGDVSLKATVKKFADVQKKMQQGGFQPGGQPEWPDPRKLIADGLARSVQQTLSVDQAKRYQVELEKRAAARKRVALINLVVKIDRDLVLSAEQRNQLTERLNSNWKDVWGQQLEVFLYGDQYLPVLPDDQVLPILSEKQKEIWQGTPKNQNTIGGWAGFGFIQPVEIEEELPADANPVDQKKKEEQP